MHQTPVNPFFFMLFAACCAAACAQAAQPAPEPVTEEPATAGLIRVVYNAITGEVVEWWSQGPEASARDRDLRSCHRAGEIQRSTGRPPQAALLFGPRGEHVATTAVTLRYRPNGFEPQPGHRPISVVRAKAAWEVV